MSSTRKRLMIRVTAGVLALVAAVYISVVVYLASIRHATRGSLTGPIVVSLRQAGGEYARSQVDESSPIYQDAIMWLNRATARGGLVLASYVNGETFVECGGVRLNILPTGIVMRLPMNDRETISFVFEQDANDRLMIRRLREAVSTDLGDTR